MFRRSRIPSYINARPPHLDCLFINRMIEIFAVRLLTASIAEQSDPLEEEEPVKAAILYPPFATAS